MSSTVSNLAGPQPTDSTAEDVELESFPVVYSDPLPARQAAVSGDAAAKKKKSAALTPPRGLPAKGIFSSLSTAKILEQSPPVSSNKPEVQPGTWSDAVPENFYARPGRSPLRTNKSILTHEVVVTETPTRLPVMSAAAAAEDATPMATTSTPSSPPDVSGVAAARTPTPQSGGCEHCSSPAPCQPPTHTADAQQLQSEVAPSPPSPQHTTADAHTECAALATPAEAPVALDAAHPSEPAHDDMGSDVEDVPSPFRPTEASRRRSLSVRAEQEALHRRPPSPVKMDFKRPEVLFGDPPQVDRSAVSPARSPSASGEVAHPKGFDKYEEEGRRKREALEAREAEEARLASQAPSFKPAISAAAQRHKSSSTFDEFLAQQAQKQQETEERHRRLSQALIEKEEEQRKSVFVNAHSQRLLEKRARRQGATASRDSATAASGSPRTGPRLSIVDRLDEVVAMQRENRERLRRESQPTFQPELATRPSRSASAQNRAATTGEATAQLLLTDGHTSEKTGEADTDGSRSRSRSKEGGADKYAFFVSLYERTVAQKEATRAKLERMKAQEIETVSPRTSQRLTTADAEALVADIERREAERRQRWENKLKQAQREEEEKLHNPQLSPKTKKLAERAKSRWALEEQRRKAALEEAKRKQASRPLYVKTAEARSPAFEQHQSESLDRRARRLAELRQQQLESELRECTFRPRLSPETERIAEHFSVEPTVLELASQDGQERLVVDDGADTELGRGRVVRSSSRRQSPMKEDPRLSSHDGISPLFDPDRRRLLREIDQVPSNTPAAAVGVGASHESPAPCAPQSGGARGGSSLYSAMTQSQPQPRAAFSLESDASLQSHIQSLEEVLGEWQSLERELSSTPPPRSTTTSDR